jgi:hypothetical protein
LNRIIVVQDDSGVNHARARFDSSIALVGSHVVDDLLVSQLNLLSRSQVNQHSSRFRLAICLKALSGAQRETLHSRLTLQLLIRFELRQNQVLAFDKRDRLPWLLAQVTLSDFRAVPIAEYSQRQRAENLV